MCKSAVLATLLAAADDSDNEEEAQGLSLDELYTSYNNSQPLAVGDKVRWKKCRKNKRGGHDQEFIIAEVFETPLIDESENPGNVYYREALTVKAACIDQGSFVFYHLDGARLEKVA